MARRPLNAFALSFLDCMCCGFGAVILVFMIISAKIQEESDEKLEDLATERVRLESQVLAGERVLGELRGSLTRALETQVVAQQLQSSLRDDIVTAELELVRRKAELGEARSELAARRARIEELEKSKAEAGSSADELGRQLRRIEGEGSRQYLTGMRMGGRRILILVDTSASMLDSTIVNVVRLRYLPKAQRLAAPKWKQAVATVDWLTANLPPESEFQIYRFDTTARPLLGDEGEGWLPVGDGKKLDEAVEVLRKTAPEGGTSLHAAFSVIGTLEPRPDNVYLLVDGLPTQGARPSQQATVSGRTRLKHFDRATNRLPGGVPINVILFAMEGDPYASERFWALARSTRGSFLSPAVDWP